MHRDDKVLVVVNSILLFKKDLTMLTIYSKSLIVKLDPDGKHSPCSNNLEDNGRS